VRRFFAGLTPARLGVGVTVGPALAPILAVRGLLRKSAIDFIANLERTIIEGQQLTATEGQKKAGEAARKLFDRLTKNIASIGNIYGALTVHSTPLNVRNAQGNLVTNPALSGIRQNFGLDTTGLIKGLEAARIAVKMFGLGSAQFAKHIIFAHGRIASFFLLRHYWLRKIKRSC